MAVSLTMHWVANACPGELFENQSGGVIEMLDKLLDKFIEERTQFQTEERSEFKAQPIKANADATGDLQDTTSTCDEAFSVV